MTTITFDTHEFIKELKSAGFSEEQAEIITKLQKAAVSSTLEQARHDYDLDNLVTNQSLDLRIKDVELKIAETKADLIRWVVSVGLLQTALIAGLLLKLISALP
jgi:predicted lipid-binding transport protein (Tim44 family)